MSDDIRVVVLTRADRTNLTLRYTDPITGRQHSKSAGTKHRREAERAAARWEKEIIESGEVRPSTRGSWERFIEAWEAEAGAALRPRSLETYYASINLYERVMTPDQARQISDTSIKRFKAAIVRRGLAQATVARHLRHLKSIFRWGAQNGYLIRAPKIDIPGKRQGAQKMRGRPLTDGEFAQMRGAVGDLVGRGIEPEWQLFLDGLWMSGLRLSEALALRWDRTRGGLWLALNGRKSLIGFEAAAQKSGRAEFSPLAPEAYQLLAPTQRKQGFVFTLSGMCRDRSEVGRLISSIGKASGVVVDEGAGSHPTAHDLRRSFGYRWSRRIMPAQLMSLMRHASISTTMTYYVGSQAQQTAEELWEAIE